MGFEINQASWDLAYRKNLLASKDYRRGCSSFDFLLRKDFEVPLVLTFHRINSSDLKAFRMMDPRMDLILNPS
jgi:hypothetical protein